VPNPGPDARQALADKAVPAAAHEFTQSGLAAAALYVIAVTRSEPEWGAWGLGSTSYVSPAAMIAEVCPNIT
jgi:hypothetical protein